MCYNTYTDKQNGVLKMSKYENLTTDDLGDYLSDYHKDTFGFRFRGPFDRATLIAKLTSLDAYHVSMRETFASRETLRSEGWHIVETDPAFIQQAIWLEQERARVQVKRDAARSGGLAVNAAEKYEDWAI